MGGRWADCGRTANGRRTDGGWTAGGRRTDGGRTADSAQMAGGQRIGLFSGSGVGKSRLLAHLARRVDTGITVIALIGERGREVNEFVRQTIGQEGMKRAVGVAANAGVIRSTARTSTARRKSPL